MKTTRVVMVLVALVFLSGCGRGILPPAQDHGDFERYFQAFEEKSREHGRPTLGDSSISIQFSETESFDEDVMGNCTGRRITINRLAWETLDESYRLSLIAHELGHCLLNRAHDSRTTLNVPDSIMYPKIVVRLGQDDEKYWDELFTTR